MLQNAYFLAKIGADTDENEQHFAEIFPIGRRGPALNATRGSTRRASRCGSSSLRGTPAHTRGRGPAGCEAHRICGPGTYVKIKYDIK